MISVYHFVVNLLFGLALVVNGHTLTDLLQSSKFSSATQSNSSSSFQRPWLP